MDTPTDDRVGERRPVALQREVVPAEVPLPALQAVQVAIHARRG